ncbi:hypothetical protein CRG98_047086 [Punica granatum]|uniref:Strictosidine synthase conserved region domain-containing protein n=1 Tax=Punica granatum TaxID=22663 RepID=A0A2I0HLB2_PUNGR|nr:hypothetical protein CRG98_047086 [Punica granatum]
MELLTNEAEGVKIKLVDGVDVADAGTIYFTDASQKYGPKEAALDLLEGRPHGRLMSFHPRTRRTEVLVHNLHFPNGVAVSPNQDFVVFCETLIRSISQYDTSTGPTFSFCGAVLINAA